jgi:hypothetical protein
MTNFEVYFSTKEKLYEFGDLFWAFFLKIVGEMTNSAKNGK